MKKECDFSKGVREAIVPNKIKAEWIREWLERTGEFIHFRNGLDTACLDGWFNLTDLADFLNEKLKEGYLPYHDSKESKLVDGEIVEED